MAANRSGPAAQRVFSAMMEIGKIEISKIESARRWAYVAPASESVAAAAPADATRSTVSHSR